MRATYGKPKGTCKAGTSCGQGGFTFEADSTDTAVVEQASETATLDQQNDRRIAELDATERQTLVCCRYCSHADWDKYPDHIAAGLVACKRNTVTGVFISYDRPHVCATYVEATL